MNYRYWLTVLPTLLPSPSPDGRSIAIASKGWLCLLDIERSVAKRLTNTDANDPRPRWFPDGKRLAFVRDYGSDMAVVVK